MIIHQSRGQSDKMPVAEGIVLTLGSVKKCQANVRRSTKLADFVDRLTGASEVDSVSAVAVMMVAEAVKRSKTGHRLTSRSNSATAVECWRHVVNKALTRNVTFSIKPHPTTI